MAFPLLTLGLRRYGLLYGCGRSCTDKFGEEHELGGFCRH